MCEDGGKTKKRVQEGEVRRGAGLGWEALSRATALRLPGRNGNPYPSCYQTTPLAVVGLEEYELEVERRIDMTCRVIG